MSNKLYRSFMTASEISTLQFQGSEINAALYKAVITMDISAITALLDQGANLHAKNTRDGTTAIYVAVMTDSLVGHDHTNTMLILPMHYNMALAHNALRRKSFQMLRLLVEHSDKFPNESYALQQRHTPLCVAVQKNKVDDLKLLLKHGADANRCSHSNCSLPLYHAFERNNTDIIKVLLQSETFFKDAYTALHLAVSRGNSEVVALLLSGNPKQDISATDDQGATALHHIVNYSTVRRDLSTKAIKTVRQLLQKGADPHKKDKKGKCSLDLLDQEGLKVFKAEHLQILHDLKTQLKISGTTPRELMFAEQWRRFNTVERMNLCLLLSVGYPTRQLSMLEIMSRFLKPLFLQMPEKYATLFYLPEVQDCTVVGNKSLSDFQSNSSTFKWESLSQELKDMILAYAFSHKILYGLKKREIFSNIPEGEIMESPEAFFSLLTQWLKRTLPPLGQYVSKESRAACRP